MMRFGIKTIALMMMALALMATGAVGADGAKVGLIDFQKVLDISDAGKEAQARINKEGKQMETDLKAKGAEIEAMRKRLEQERMVSSKEALEERGRELRIRINDFKTLQKRYAKEAREIQFKEMDKIKKDVFKLVEDLGKSGGYDLIVERQEGGIVYFPDKIDLTDKLVKQYNDLHAKQGEAKK